MNSSNYKGYTLSFTKADGKWNGRAEKVGTAVLEVFGLPTEDQAAVKLRRMVDEETTYRPGSSGLFDRWNRPFEIRDRRRR